MAELLSVEDLSVTYVGEAGDVTVVDKVSFTVDEGELVGLAGESGSGKSTVAHAVLRLLAPPAVITGGRVLWKGRDLLDVGEHELGRVRWREIALVMQSAMNALSPVLTVGEQLADAIWTHTGTRRGAALARAGELLELVGMDPARTKSYAHELSGGMRQRVGIAMALALEPQLVIMDEPTTALDVLVQREILAQIRALHQQLGFSVLLITHDLSVMFELCSKLVVLYAGRTAEHGPTAAMRAEPRHPYTGGLIRSIPDIRGDRPLAGIAGSPPDPREPPAGCRFHPRCTAVVDRCRSERPALIELGGERAAACHLVSHD